MATRTTAKNGLWSASDTWVGGVVPVSGDTCTIATGHVCTFDVDQSAFATGLAGLVINGALVASTTPGAYVLKMASNINITFGAAGYIRAGTDTNNLYPAACSFQITLQGTGQITGGVNTCRFYGPAPTNLTVKLSANEAIGQTAISVDTDLTGDPMWKAGAVVYIADINKALECEAYTIASVTATEINLTSGLTVAKSTGAVVTLSTRNIRLIGPGATGRGISAGSANNFVGVEFRGFQYALISCSTSIFTACVCSGSSYGALSCTTCVFTSCAFPNLIQGVGSCSTSTFTACIFSGSTYGAGSCSTSTFTACIFSGNTYGVGICSMSVFADCVVSGNGTGAYNCASRWLNNTFTNNTQDFSQLGHNTGWGNLLNSATQHAVYLQAGPYWVQTVMWDIGGVPDALKAWMRGGRIVTDSTIYPSGFTQSQKFIHEAADAPVYLDIPIFLTTSDSRQNQFTVHLRRDTASMTELPRVQIIDPGSDPFFDGTALLDEVMTAAVDTWQTFDLEYTPPHTGQYILRIRGTNATGNFYAAWEVPALAAEVVTETLSVTVTDDTVTVNLVEDVIAVEVTG